MGRAPARGVAAVRRSVIASAFPPSDTLAAVLDRVGFVQADPIRAPARAQDLVLRHRVATYRAGELEQRYPELPLEENFLYAYGFTTHRVHDALHPRGGRAPTGLARRVLDAVRERDVTHPRELVAQFGARTRVNAWGGVSRATTRVLEELHYRGHVRVVRRERGVRLYGPARDRRETLSPGERLRRLVLQLAANFAPCPESSLRHVVRYLRWGAPSLPGRERIIPSLLHTGELAAAEVEGVRYVWPASTPDPLAASDVARVVRFLAPFDPVIWDRRRLELLWGWDYRFEAYTPAAKRRFGHYALPVLWEDRFVGWVNVAVRGPSLEVRPGWIEGRPRERDFVAAFDDEVERMRDFLADSAGRLQR